MTEQSNTTRSALLADMNIRADNPVPVITLDGPSGTGKGTLCHRLAAALGFHFLDSGAIYRILAYAALEKHIVDTDTPALILEAASMHFRFAVGATGEVETYLGDRNVSEAIRTETVAQEASKIATIPEIRTALLQRQRDFAQCPGLVTDGRDMGTVVFPHAILKIYLFATSQERANRRHIQLREKGFDVSLAMVTEELHKRDARDMARAHSPLIPAKDAVLIDTTGLTIVQVFENILQLSRVALSNEVVRGEW
jgi:cytidylate kinase